MHPREFSIGGFGGGNVKSFIAEDAEKMPRSDCGVVCGSVRKLGLGAGE